MVCDHFTRQYDEVGMLLRQCWCLEDEHSWWCHGLLLLWWRRRWRDDSVDLIALEAGMVAPLAGVSGGRLRLASGGWRALVEADRAWRPPGVPLKHLAADLSPRSRCILRRRHPLCRVAGWRSAPPRPRRRSGRWRLGAARSTVGDGRHPRRQGDALFGLKLFKSSWWRTFVAWRRESDLLSAVDTHAHINDITKQHVLPLCSCSLFPHSLIAFWIY